jgi:D-alanyl-D-alanine carboxypeptidase
MPIGTSDGQTYNDQSEHILDSHQFGLTSIESGGYKATVNTMAAPKFKGFLDDLGKAGAPIGSVQGYNYRNIAGTNTLSQHAYGNAIDIGNQTGRDQVSPEFRQWVTEHPTEWRGALNKYNMISGGDWRHPDLGHVEYAKRPIMDVTKPYPHMAPEGAYGLGSDYKFIDRSTDVPLLAGALVDPSTGQAYGTAIDRRIPAFTTIEGLTFDPAQFVHEHEMAEHPEMEKHIATGMDPLEAYKKAHNEVATPTEKEHVQKFAKVHGKDPESFWDQYQKFWSSWLKTTGNQEPEKVNPHLYIHPYEPGIKEKMAALIHKAAVASGAYRDPSTSLKEHIKNIMNYGGLVMGERGPFGLGTAGALSAAGLAAKESFMPKPGPEPVSMTPEVEQAMSDIQAALHEGETRPLTPFEYHNQAVVRALSDTQIRDMSEADFTEHMNESMRRVSEATQRQIDRFPELPTTLRRQPQRTQRQQYQYQPLPRTTGGGTPAKDKPSGTNFTLRAPIGDEANKHSLYGQAATHIIENEKGEPIASASITPPNKFSPDVAHLEGIRSIGDWASNVLGPKGMRQVAKQYQKEHPEIEWIEAYRVSGARARVGGHTDMRLNIKTGKVIQGEALDKIKDAERQAYYSRQADERLRR